MASTPYLEALEPLYVPALRDLAHTLSQQKTNVGLPLAYFVFVVVGYQMMRNVNFYYEGSACKAKKPGDKKISKCVIKKVLDGGKKVEVSFGPGAENAAALPSDKVFPDGWAPPDWFKQTYNLVQVSLSVYTALFGMPVVFDMLKHPFGVGLSLSSSDPVNKALHYCVCIHFLSKFLDYVDTILIIIGKKDRQLSVLHVYHHCSISMVWGYLIDYPIAYGTICFGAWINAVVHSIMYTYYGLTAARFNTKPFKQAVTTVQLTQFCLCIAHAITVLVISNEVRLGCQPAGVCACRARTAQSSHLVPSGFLLQPVFLFLFFSSASHCLFFFWLLSYFMP